MGADSRGLCSVEPMGRWNCSNRNHLDAAGVRERHCVVCVPLKWALIVQVELPNIPEADVASFLQIEAERGFPCDVATLRLATSRWRASNQKQYATLIGIPENHLSLLQQALQGAKLKIVSFSLGIAALQPPDKDASNGMLALVIGESHIELQITSGGGVAALRALEGALETEGGRTLLHADVVTRETRITLGQLPPELRETVRRARVFGPSDLAQELAEELEARLETTGLRMESVPSYSANEFGVQLPANAPVSRAFSLAARHLTESGASFELLATRYSSSRLRMAGATAGAVALLVGFAFLIQQWQLTRLGSRWNAMSAKVTELDVFQQQIRQYRPWFDDSFRCLSILRQLTMVFPDDGVVSAKTLEIRDVNVVTCTGIARDNASFLRTLGQLRAADNVTDLKVDQIRGKSPMQFTFDFHWNEGVKNAN